MISVAVKVLLVLFIIYAIFVYNRGISLRNYVKEAFSTMDVYLKKRWDLIPNLIETVKGYAQHEQNLLNELTQARTKNYANMSEKEKIQTHTQLGTAIPKIFALAENYPDLKANQSFIELMNELSAIENDIANARKYYNGTVRELNTFTETFPSNLMCKIFGIKPEKMFVISEDERTNIQVKF